MTESPLLCHVVADGRAGVESQALGLAEALARRIPLQIEIRRLKRPGRLARALRAIGAGSRPEPHPGPAPDLWIGTGGEALRQAAAERARFPEALFVCVQDPRGRGAPFDLVIAPEHDALEGDRVVSILGSPNRVTAERLSEGVDRFRDRLAALPDPKIAVLIGGPSRRHRYDSATKARLESAIADLKTAGAGLMITASRRTPARIRRFLESLGDDPAVWVWDGTGDNPYFAFLGAADGALVTADSTNMLTEAASAGLTVMLLEVGGAHGKFDALYDALIARGYGVWFAGDIERWPAEPLRETERAAAEIARRLAAT